MGTPNFSTNTWYQITESRVDFNSSLQVLSDDPGSLAMRAACDDCLQKWQIIPSTFGTQADSNGSFVFRNQATGTTRQLGVCYAPNEQDSSRTRPCMLEAGGGNLAGPFTKWDITTWSSDSDSALKITNVGNGTDYNLDCHKGNPLFLSSNTAPQPYQPAQHWLFSSIGVINDQTYSTGIPDGPRSHRTTSTTSTASPSTSPTATSTPAPSSSGLSPGAAAGIGVGVGLAALAAILLALLLYRRRRRRNRLGSAASDSVSPSTGGAGGVGSARPSSNGYGQIDHKFGPYMADDSPRYEMNGVAPAELESGATVARELPVKHPGEGRSPILQVS